MEITSIVQLKHCAMSYTRSKDIPPQEIVLFNFDGQDYADDKICKAA